MLSRFTTRQIVLVLALAVCALFSLFVLAEPTISYAHETGSYHTHDDGTAAAKSSSGAVQAIFQTFSHGLSFVLAHIAILGLEWGIFVMAVFGVLLDLSLLLTFNMGAILAQGTSIGDAIAQAWTIFRDLANLMFIAGMVWVSIAMILQVQVPGGSVGKFIANIIVAALLVNFSFFFTGVIIDASNNISRLIYQEGVLNGKSVLVQDTSLAGMIKTVTGGKQIIDTSKEDVVSASFGFIGSQFVHQTKLSSIISPGLLREKASLTDGNYTIILIALVGGALITATIQLFASLFFLIIGRFILLIILLTLSPLIVFSIMGIPPFSEWGKHWWNSLMSQVIFLPVFVFLTATSFRITNGFIATVAGGDVSIAEIVGTPTGAEWNLALGLIITYIIAWGLLKQAKTISENIAQGKQVQLPSVEMIQGGAAKIGTAVGGYAERIATLPRQIGRAAVGQTLRELGDLPGVKQLRTGVTEGVSGAYKGGRALLDDSYRYQYDREQRAKKEGIEKIAKTQQEILDLEARAGTEADPIERAKLNKLVDEAKGRLKSQADSMFEALGAKGMAKRIGDSKEIDGATQQAILDSLEDEKAREVYEELRNSGKLKAKGEGAGAGNKTTPPATENAVDADKIITELKGMRRDQRIEAMREKKADMRAITATKESARKYRTEIGSGALGELPVDVILENDAVRHEMDEADIELFASRSDVSDEEFEAVRQKVAVSKQRKAMATPADITNPEPPDDGSSTAWLRAQQRRNAKRSGNS